MTKLDDLERRVQRLEAAIEASALIAMPPPDVPTGLSAEQRAEAEARAAKVRELAAQRQRYEFDGTPIEPTAA